MSRESLTTQVERALIGGIVARGSVELAHVRTAVDAASLGDPVARAVFEAACECSDKGAEVTAVTIAAAAERRGVLGSVGGLEGLGALAKRDRPGEREALIRRVLSHAKVRQTVARAEKIAAAGRLPETLESPDQYLASVSAMAKDARRSISSETVDARAAAAMTYAHFKAKGVMQVASPTGIDDLDVLLGGGLKRKRSYVVGARPGVGKSAFSVASMYHGAERGHPQLMFSLEMPVEDIVGRRVVQTTQLAGDRWEKGLAEFTGEEHRRIIGAMGRLAELPVHIEATVKDVGAMLALAKIWLETTAAAAMAADASLVPVVWFDYLQRCRLAGKFSSREELISTISDMISSFSRENDCATVLVAQINRSNKKEDRPPRCDDLRESGAIEADANAIILLHRDAGASGSEVSAEDGSTARVIEQDALILLDKNRNGPTGIVRAAWSGPTGQYLNRRTWL